MASSFQDTSMIAQTPVPSSSKDHGDPSPLATQQVWREIEHVIELMTTRFEAMDKAINLLQDFANRSPTIAVVDVDLKSLKELVLEKFASVQKQFQERDARIDQTAKDSKTAIDAALQAAEKSVAKQNENFSEANDKSERSVTKEIDATKALIAQNQKTTDDKIAALEKRLSEITGQSAGAGSAVTWIIAAVGFLLTLLSIGGAVIAIVK